MNIDKVHIFVFDSLSDWEASYAIAGINNPLFQKAPGRFQVTSVGLTKAPVITAGGLRVQPDLALDDLSPADSRMLLLPGGMAWDDGKNDAAVDTARHVLAAGVPVAAICGATGGLARGGLLDERQHTSNAREYLAATEYRGAPHYRDQPVVTDDNLITASGTAAVEFAYHIFKQLDLYTPPVLEAWFGLFKTGQAEYFGELMQAVNA